MSYGLMIEFKSSEQLLEAARKVRSAGYVRFEAYSPFAVEGLSDAVGFHDHKVALFTLLGGIAGGLTGYLMQWYSAVYAYPINVGGRPLHSAPSFIPITFELTVLFASLAAMISMFALNRLPKPYHPVFNVRRFLRASQDRFFLCIEASDPQFDEAATRQLLEELGGEGVYEVEP